jgi:hypothetical protein
MNFKKCSNFPHINAVIAFCLFFSACKKENACDCFKRTGDIIRDTRQLSGFTELLIKDNLNVFITQDSVFEVTVEAGENIAPLITTEVVGTTLVCRNKNRCNFTRSYKKPLNIYIHMPLITEIESSGTGDVKSLNTIETPAIYLKTISSGNTELTVNTPKLTSSMHGSADLTLYGTVNNHECDTGGSGFLNAAGLHTNYTYLHSATLGLCYIYVADLLICKLDQKGDIFCYGNPKTVNSTSSSSGKLYIQ